ncbi:hypothetical protein PFISCL1PPCAC_1714, partial [Pristionchus fissidentatus]
RMPPKKTSAASKKETKKINIDFENRKDDILREAAERTERMKEFAEEKEDEMFDKLCASIQTLDPRILIMTLGEFISMPVTIGEETKENEDMRNTREMTVENGGRRLPVGDFSQTAIRPQKDRGGMELRTPAGSSFKCPSLITPRVGGGSLLSTRTIRGDEIAFSVAGSPVVINVPNGNGDAAIDQLHQLINADETSLTPNTRNLVKNIREVMQRKMGDSV